MYNESYEDYIRSILGYPRMSDISGNYMYNQNEIDDMNYNYSFRNSEEAENFYPEIYRIIYPMVEKACRENVGTITQELLDNMTDEIYMAVEDDNGMSQININLGNNIRTGENRGNTPTSKNEESKEMAKEEKDNQNNRQIGQFRNRILRDLIKILLIRELFPRPRFPNNRPPMRPPYPGGPGRPPMRPPYPGGNRYNNYDLYEF